MKNEIDNGSTMRTRVLGALKQKSPRYCRLIYMGFSAMKVLGNIVRARKGAMNYLKCYISAALRLDVSLGRPIMLTIEPTNICDHKCTICETGSGDLGRSSRVMSFDEFKGIIDQFDDKLRIIYFYFMGESFLNRDSYKMIRYAADKGLYVSACTNGVCVDPEMLVRSGIADIQYQIAGMTNDVHNIYRVGGDLNATLRNLTTTIQYRDRLSGSVARPYPMQIGLGFILMKHNEHQVDEFVSYAKSAGVDEYNVINTCVRTIEQGKELLPSDDRGWIYDPDMFRKGILSPWVKPDNHCEWLYSTITVQVDGNVVPCCRDPRGKWVMGNLHHEGIYDIWNNDKYRSLRRDVVTRQEYLPLCALCEGYRLPSLPHAKRK